MGKIWRQEKIPIDWSKGVIIKLPKKGDLKKCDNWRGIMLLSIPSKVLCKVILNRMDKQIDTKLREEQAGFRAGRGCFDQIFTHRTVIEQSAEENHRRQKRGLQWGLMGHLEDLNFADDLALISETIKHLQDKTNRLFK